VVGQVDRAEPIDRGQIRSDGKIRTRTGDTTIFSRGNNLSNRPSIPVTGGI